MAKYSWYFVISDKTSYSAARLKYFHIIHQSISCIEHLFISFSSDFFIYQLDFFVFWSVWALTFSVAFDIVPEFLFFFLFFRMLWMQLQPPEVFFVKRCSLEISQHSQENTCTRVSFLIKLQPSALQLYFKRDSGTGVFLLILWNL